MNRSIAIAADLHFGVPGKLNDVLWACRVMRQYCHIAGIDVVVILGDLFHERVAVSVDVTNAVYRFMEETKTDYQQQWVVFPGNHDMFLRHSWDITSLTPLKQLMTVVDDVALLEIDGKRFWVIPFIQSERSYMKVVELIESHVLADDVLLTHIGINGAALNSCFLLKDWSIVDFSASKFKVVYAGHFHARQQVGVAHYPGSLIPFKYDEGDVPHGFFVHNLDDLSHKFVNIWKAGAKFFPNEAHAPQFLTVDSDKLGSLTTDMINGNNVRIRGQEEVSPTMIAQLRGSVLALGARSVRWLPKKRDSLEKHNQGTAVVANSNHAADLFEAWMAFDVKNLSTFDRKILKQISNEVISIGDSTYNASRKILEDIGE